MSEYSSMSASTSLRTQIHSTLWAVATICAVRSWRVAGSAKYEDRRWRSDLALPT